MNLKYLTALFKVVSIILILFGITYTFFGLKILPVNPSVLLHWESALYGAIMTGWGVTLYMIGQIAFRRNDPEIMKAILCGLLVWLILEAIFSAYLHVWFNVGVDIGVMLLFSFPIINNIRSQKNKKI